MNINVNTQNVAVATIVSALNAGTEVALHDATYGVTITATGAGFAVTDVTGGDQDAATVTEALTIAAGFITEMTEGDADWAQIAQILA